MGTSHVSQESADKVKTIINHIQPEYVLLELDERRAEILENMPKDALSGVDLRTALHAARDVGAEVIFADIDAKETMPNVWKAFITPRSIKSFVIGCFNPIRFFENVSVIMKNVRSPKPIEPTRADCRKITLRSKEEYPDVYEQVVTLREKFMFEKAKPFVEEGKSFVFVMGMAHMDGLEERFVAHEEGWEPPVEEEAPVEDAEDNDNENKREDAETESRKF